MIVFPFHIMLSRPLGDSPGAIWPGYYIVTDGLVTLSDKYGVPIAAGRTELGFSSKVAGEELPMRLRRLKYRAWHRGTKEMDLLLGPFADARLANMSATELDRFEALLNEADTDLLAWLMGQEPVPEKVDQELLDDVLTFRTIK